MTFKDLEYIWTISQEQSITKASRKLGVSQPAASRCLMNMEKEVGVKLFEKTSGAYIPTAAGQVYLEFAEDALKRKHKFETDLRGLQQYRQGNLRFGITPGRSKTLTPKVLPEISRQFPDVRVEMFEDNVDNLEELLRSGKIDVAYFTAEKGEVRENSELYMEILREEEIVMTIKKGTPLSLEPARKYGFLYPWVDMTQFQDKTFISLKKSMRLGQITRQILRGNRINPQIVQLTSIDTAQELAIRGYGVCLCSSLGVREYKELLDIYSFGEQPIKWDFVAAYRVGSHITEPLQCLTDAYCKAAEAMQCK